MGGGYQVNKWFEAGSYYSHYRLFATAGPGSPPPIRTLQVHDFDKVVTAKFLLPTSITVKVEGHFMDGNATALYPAGFYANVNQDGFADNTNALVARTGFSF